MPTYEYSCKNCGHELESFHRMSADPLVDCPSCDTPSLKRKIGLGAGIIFKGGGFYETDFKDKKGKPDTDSSTKENPAPKAEKKEKTPEKKDKSGD